MIAKSVSIKDAGGKSGGRVSKALPDFGHWLVPAPPKLLPYGFEVPRVATAEPEESDAPGCVSDRLLLGGSRVL
jgi:hypothetical protein